MKNPSIPLKARPTMDRFYAIFLVIGAFVFGAFIMKMAIICSFRYQKLKLEYIPQADITAAFHRIYHNDWWQNTMEGTSWMGYKIMQTPLDMWIIQEIIHETKPDVLIETGTHMGGASLYYANVFDLEQHGRVLTVDIEDFPGRSKHPRIRFFQGSSTSPEIVAQIRSDIRPGERVMVVLDSYHAKEHVLKEIESYKDLICPGNYLIVEDTHLNGHPIYVDISPGPGKLGPMEAVEEFLAKDDRFVPDKTREKFGLTYCPNGWLKRVH
jgi:cephalosporin hydroxylase